MKRDGSRSPASRVSRHAARPSAGHGPRTTGRPSRRTGARVTAGKPQIVQRPGAAAQDFGIDAELAAPPISRPISRTFSPGAIFGYPDPAIGNGYAMGALQGSDGALHLRRHGSPHGRISGRIYFPVWHARPSGPASRRHRRSCDQRHPRTRGGDGASARANTRSVERWIVVSHWPASRSCAVQLPRAGRSGRTTDPREYRGQDDPELPDVRVVRGMQDMTPEQCRHSCKPTSAGPSEA